MIRSTVSAVSTSVAGNAGRLVCPATVADAGVGGDVERAHPLGDVVAELPGGVDDLVELQVQVAEVLADDVPVRLLALEVQVDEVDEQLLQVGGELLGGEKRRVHGVGGGLGVLERRGHGRECARLS